MTHINQLAGQPFNSTSPRFAEKSSDVEAPGPGQYLNNSFGMTSGSSFRKTSPTFLDASQRIDGPNGYLGHVKH